MCFQKFVLSWWWFFFPAGTNASGQKRPAGPVQNDKKCFLSISISGQGQRVVEAMWLTGQRVEEASGLERPQGRWCHIVRLSDSGGIQSS